MTRPLPPEYEGWEARRAELRGAPIGDLIARAGSPDAAERMAALTAVDISRVPAGTMLEWMRTLAPPEANQLAGAIQAQIEAADCTELLRWAGTSRVGYEQRGLATYLVLLFTALEALEAASCTDTDAVWERTSTWVCDHALALLVAGDRDAFDDLSLFVFENYLDRSPLFTAFKGLLGKRRDLALRVSANPGLYLSGLAETSQREMLEATEKAGGIPLKEAWKLLHGLTVKKGDEE